eukprot:TRINITY_DN7302_c0_g1_i2.p1 TRINITY_DN7302_c0_g1~~TRINITY_DN7302_c0_g1_i2.p1  ORF type:complete len:601 (+),score=103.02 TRINITY_DN7302_c0_g1_i2:64-1866(+)
MDDTVVLSWLTERYLSSGIHLQRVLVIDSSWIILIDPVSREIRLKKELSLLLSASFDQRSDDLFRILFRDGDVILLLSTKREEIISSLEVYFKQKSLDSLLKDPNTELCSYTYGVNAIDRFGNAHKHWLQMKASEVLHIDQNSSRILLKHRFDQISDFEKTAEKYTIKYGADKGYHFLPLSQSDLEEMIALISSRILIYDIRINSADYANISVKDIDSLPREDVQHVIDVMESPEKQEPLISQINRGFPSHVKNSSSLISPQAQMLPRKMSYEQPHQSSPPKLPAASQNILEEQASLDPRLLLGINASFPLQSPSPSTKSHQMTGSNLYSTQASKLSFDVSIQTTSTSDIGIQAMPTNSKPKQRLKREDRQRTDISSSDSTEDSDTTSTESTSSRSKSSHHSTEKESQLEKSTPTQTRKHSNTQGSTTLSERNSSNSQSHTGSGTLANPAVMQTIIVDRAIPALTPQSPLLGGHSPISHAKPGPHLSMEQIKSTLRKGTYLYKHVQNGAKKPHRRYFTFDPSTLLLQWGKKESSRKKKKFYITRLVCYARPEIQSAQPSFSALNRSLSFTLYSHDRCIDLAAENEVMFRAWVEGITKSLG